MGTTSQELTFGNYRILRRDNGDLWELGKGGFGTTYKAEHKHLMRESALKVINADRVSSEEAKKRFLQEGRAAAAMHHPNIAAVHDFGEEDGVFYYAMEFCSGGDLENFSEQKGAMTWDQVEPVAVQILEALNHSHEKGMLHRDLKPSNVMLVTEGDTSRLKLIDFGLVKVLETKGSSSTQVMLTQEGAAGFNPLTASPEQLREEDLDERSDLFSVGVTLLFLLNGGSPFGNISAAVVMAQRLDDKSYDSLLPDSLQGAGRKVLSNLLQKDKENRYRFAHDVIDAIRSGESEEAEVVSEEAEVQEEVQDVPPVPEVKTPQIQEPSTAHSLGLGDWDWGSGWSVQGVQQQCAYGTYYLAKGNNATVPDATLFLPNLHSPSISKIVDFANQLVGDEMIPHVVAFQKAGVLDGESAYLCACPPVRGGRYIQLLQAVGTFALQDHLGLFQQTAKAVDTAITEGFPGVELDVSSIVVGSHGDSGAPQNESSDVWLEYYQKCLREDEKFATRAGLIFFTKLEAPQDLNDVGATLSGDDLATNPLAQFGSLIYRSISGMSVKSAAYLNSSVYVSTSNLGEESNRYLAGVISGDTAATTAEEVLGALCGFEGVAWSEESLHNHLQYQQQEKDLFEMSLNRIDPSLFAQPSAPVEKAAVASEPEKVAVPVVKEVKQPERRVVEPQKTEVAKPPVKEVAARPEPKPAPRVAQPQEAPEEAPRGSGQEEEKSKTKPIAIAVAAVVVIVLLLAFMFKPKGDEPAKDGIASSGSSTPAQSANPGTGTAGADTSGGANSVSSEASVEPDPIPLAANNTSIVIDFDADESEFAEAVTLKLYQKSDAGSSKLISKLKRRGGQLVASLAGVPVSKHMGASSYLLKADHPTYQFLDADGESHTSELKLTASDFEFDEAKGLMRLSNKPVIKLRPEVTIKLDIKSCGRDVDGALAVKLIQALIDGKYLQGAAKEKDWLLAEGKADKELKLTMPYGAVVDKNTKLEIKLPLFKSASVSVAGRRSSLRELSFDPELTELDLSTLSDRLPKFDKVIYQASAKEEGNDLARKMIAYYPSSEVAVAYKNIDTKLKVLNLPGSLKFVGGPMDGISLPGAAKKGASKPDVPQFPKAYLYSHVDIPTAYSLKGKTVAGPKPGLASLHFDDEGGLSAYLVYVFGEKWTVFGTRLKVKSYLPERSEWVLVNDPDVRLTSQSMDLVWSVKIVGNEVELRHQEVIPQQQLRQAGLKNSDFSARWRLKAWPNWQRFEKSALNGSLNLWKTEAGKKYPRYNQYPMSLEMYRSLLQGGGGMQ